MDGIYLDLRRHHHLLRPLRRRHVLTPHILTFLPYDKLTSLFSYTAVVLLAFDRWTNTVERTELINFNIAKWIFCACIFLSLIICGIDWFYAVRVIKSDGVAVAYMNVIALRYNCIRGGPGKGDTGWKRFLVFSKLTESRGFVDYIALLTYFSFKGWIRVIFAEGPRVVINTLTFISVTKADDMVTGGDNALNAIEKFAKNFAAMYEEDKTQVIVLCTMGFTTLLWIFSILRLFAAACSYVCYLWHAMGGSSLHDYCKDRIDSRMTDIVKKKHDKALAKEKKANDKLLRQPTIPVFGPSSPPPSSSSFAPLKRSNTEEALGMGSTANLLPHHSHPSPPQSIYTTASAASSNLLNREPTLPNISELEKGYSSPAPAMPSIPPQHQRQVPTRQQSNAAYNSYSTILDAYHDPTPTGTPPPMPLQSLPPHRDQNQVLGGYQGPTGPFPRDRVARQPYPESDQPISYDAYNPGPGGPNGQFGHPQRSMTGGMGVPRPMQGPINRGMAGTAPPSMEMGYGPQRRPSPLNHQQQSGTPPPQGQNTGGYVTYNPALDPSRNGGGSGGSGGERESPMNNQNQDPGSRRNSIAGSEAGSVHNQDGGPRGAQGQQQGWRGHEFDFGPNASGPNTGETGYQSPYSSEPQQDHQRGPPPSRSNLPVGTGGYNYAPEGMRPPPRAATAGPSAMGGQGAEWTPPPRSLTAGPGAQGMRGPPGPPRREDWGHKQPQGPLGPPQQQQRGPPPQRGPPRAEDW